MAYHRLSPPPLRLVLLVPVALAAAACEGTPAAPRALPAVTITVTPAQLTLPIGTSARLTATVQDAEGRTLTDRTITWTSGAPKVATVSAAGVVRAIGAGIATISAFSDPGLGLARVVVQEDFRLPLPAGKHWLLRTETGTAAAGCAENEGGRRLAGGRDCSHGGVSRYSLDFAAVTEEDGALTLTDSVPVLAAADGRVIDICLLPQAVTCGLNGPFVAVEHRGGFRTIYAHLDPASIMVRRKTPLVRGQVIGVMAAGAPASSPWVHFELRFQNQGAGAAATLEALLLDGRELTDYRVNPDAPSFYRSTNAGDEETREAE